MTTVPMAMGQANERDYDSIIMIMAHGDGERREKDKQGLLGVVVDGISGRGAGAWGRRGGVGGNPMSGYELNGTGIWIWVRVRVRYGNTSVNNLFWSFDVSFSFFLLYGSVCVCVCGLIDTRITSPYEKVYKASWTNGTVM